MIIETEMVKLGLIPNNNRSVIDSVLVVQDLVTSVVTGGSQKLLAKAIHH